MDYLLNVAGLERHLPLCKVSDDLYIAAFIMFNDVEVTVACASKLLEKAPEFDVIITAESKGIPLAYEMARQAGNKPYIVARKGPKIYMDDLITVSVDSITTDHMQTLCVGREEREAMEGKRILIAVGGNIVGQMAVLAEGDAADRDDIIFLEKLPLFGKDGQIL